MIKKDIKVEPKKDDITRTMFLSVYNGFELQLSKDYDDYDYCFSLAIPSSENDFGTYWYDYYVYYIDDTISMNNISTITENIIKQLKQSVIETTDVTNKSVINAIILEYLSDIKDELKGLLLEVANGCDFCLGYESLGNLDLNGNTLMINTFNPEEVKIKYCPLCGRKLKES